MKYKDTLLSFIRQDKIDEMTLWIKTHSDMDQLDILTELKTVWKQEAEENGTENDEDFKDHMLAFDSWVEEYQEKILDVHMAELKFELATDERDKAFAKMQKSIDGVKKYVIECIVTNADNAKEMLVLARQIIAVDKESGFYNENEWVEINHLL